MGFIKAGKPLKRRRAVIKPSKSPKFGPVTKKNKPSTQPLPPTSLTSLPTEIIQRIFLLARPNNGLPLVSKYFNSLLKFDPHFECKDDSGWKWRNLSLALGMIKYWYVCDLNSRIDFQLIGKKIDHYRTRLEQLAAQFEYNKTNPEESIQTNTNYKMIVRNLEIIRETIVQFRDVSNAKALSDKLLINRFVSVNLIQHFFKSRAYTKDKVESDTYLKLMPETHIAYEIRTRLRFLRYKFNELSLYLQYLTSQVNGIPVPDTPIAERTDIEDQPELITEDNEKLAEHDDERRKLESRSSDTSNCPFIQQNNTVYYNFEGSQSLDFPSPVYNRGIDSSHKFELVQLLRHIYSFYLEDTERFLINTFENFMSNPLQINTQEISLDQVVYFVLNNMKEDAKISQQTILALLKLYSIYESRDCQDYGLNYCGDTASEDISKALISLVTRFYESPNPDDGEIWRYLLELKNYNLAQLFMKFTEGPSFDLL